VELDGRTVSGGYRFGFQNQEKDDEVKGEGNSINYTFRMHDPRLGRFFAVDPLIGKYPFYSSYSFSGNRVIDAIELEGLEPKDAKEGERILVIVLLGYSEAEEPPKGKTLYKNNPNKKSDISNYSSEIGLTSIEKAFSDNAKVHVAVFSTSLNDDKTKVDAEKTMNIFRKENPNGKIILVGHSKGADLAITISTENPGIDIELLYTLDIQDNSLFSINDDNIPSNVKNAINVYQEANFTELGGEDIEFNSTKTKGFNHRANEKNTTHSNIDNIYAKKVISRIQKVVNGKCPVSEKENQNK
jgi:hypothetical protein